MDDPNRHTTAQPGADGAQGNETPINTERLRALLAALTNVERGGGGRRVEEALTALPALLDEVDRLRAENDELHEDVVRFITQRNLVCEALAARIIPGPDGQDDIDRQRLIQEVAGDAWGEVDGWQEMAAKGAMVVAERDRLRGQLRDQVAAVEQVGVDLLTAISVEQKGFDWTAARTANAIDRLTKLAATPDPEGAE